MKFISLIFISFLSLSTFASEFKCNLSSEEPLSSTLDGEYLGESSDQVNLKTNSEYGVYEADKKGYNGYITLSRVSQSKVQTKNGFSEYPIQFKVTEKDDLGKTTYLLGLPLGVFGASKGYSFSALLKMNDDVLKLACSLD